MRESGGTRKTHGMRRHRLYNIFNGMVGRTERPSSHKWKDYGGRGIKICPEWRQSFAAFAEWALSHGYSPDLTLDRIDGDKDYGPENCRWATPKQQTWNRGRRQEGKTSQYVGVHWCVRDEKWIAQVECEGRRYHLGSFDDEHAAAAAYDQKARELFGEFARLNSDW